jgi:glycosyltransferase involved in cell wall biosynthesis
MKILYHHRIASKDGQYVHIEEIVEALKGLGHEIIIVAPNSITQKQFGKSSDTVKNIRKFLPGAIHEIIEFCYSIVDLIKLIKAIIKYKPDCIYERYNLFFPSGVWAKKIFGLPFILEVNAPLFEERKKNNGISAEKLAIWSEAFVWCNADYVLPVTNVLATYVKNTGVAENKIKVIPNGINKKHFARELTQTKGIEQKYNLHNRLILGFVGFVREWHRLDKVIEAIAQNKTENWHLFLVGDGPARQSLESQAEKLGVQDRVTITGIVSRQEMPKYISAFDIALQPDVVPYASPLKIFEYMFLGKAILAPDRNNIKEILTDHQDSILFSPEQEGDFIKRLCQICESKELREKIANGARQTVNDKKLYWHENALKIEQLFVPLIKKFPRNL